jgi:hypothetical protein
VPRNTLATDTFTRANAGNLGSDWDTFTGRDSGQIDTNFAKPAAITNNDGWTTYNATVPGNDQWAEVMPIRLVDALYTNCGVAVRASAPDTVTGYVCAFQHDDIFIGKQVAGVFTSLASQAYSIGTEPTNLISLEAIGTGLEGFVDGVSAISTTDASIASGRTGVSWYVDTGGDTDSIRFDYFGMGDFEEDPDPPEDPLIIRGTARALGRALRRSM